MKIKENLYWCVVFFLFGVMPINQLLYAQSGTIDFEDSKWNSMVGDKFYRGGGKTIRLQIRKWALISLLPMER